jgi:SWI/SNF-related matrix-associated actin-dependent regulator 1 of chromatin subfamily A
MFEVSIVSDDELLLEKFTPFRTAINLTTSENQRFCAMIGKLPNKTHKFPLSLMDTVCTAFNARRVPEPLLLSIKKPTPIVTPIGNLDDYVRGTVLKSYQQDMVRFALNNIRVLFAVDMGLGKTISSIVVAAYVRKNIRPGLKVLVVAPESLRANWISEIQRFTDATHTNILNGKHMDRAGSTTFTVIGYTLATRHVDTLLKCGFDMVIADEAHAVKHITSQRSQAMYKITQKAVYVLLLTGTPAHRHSELYNLLRILDSAIFKYFHHHQPRITKDSETKFYFAERYCVPTLVHIAKNRQQFTYNTSRRHEELRFLVRNMMIRKNKHELQLPPLVSEHIVVGELTNAQDKHFKQELLRVQAIKETNLKASEAVLMELTRETNRLKLPYVLSYLSDLLDSYDQQGFSESFIIFTWSRAAQDGIAQLLRKRDIGFVQINGSTPMATRTGLIDQLRPPNPSAKVGLLSLATCATGLNLAFVNLCIYAELCFDAVLLAQSQSRAHRIGQTADSVILRYLLLGQSTDSLVWQNLANKSTCAAQLLDGVVARKRPREKET